jgi:putative transcriptional regulator
MADIKAGLSHYMLLSMPQLQDENFSNSLIYICEHTEQGAMGLIVNRANNIRFDEILPQLDISPQHATNLGQTIYTGGPVQPEHGFVLHTPVANQKWQSSIKVGDNLCLTTSVDVIDDIAHSAGPDHSLIALGYSGWGPGQLEAELANNSWLCCPFDPVIVFHTPAEGRLKAATAKLGFDINLISNQVGHA